MKSVSIIDYGKGNVRSVYNALDYIGVESIITKDSKEIDNSSHIILPGVGAYGDAMKSIRDYGLDEVLHEQCPAPFVTMLGDQRASDRSMAHAA